MKNAVLFVRLQRVFARGNFEDVDAVEGPAVRAGDTSELGRRFGEGHVHGGLAAFLAFE